jgi:hypothetical protein
MNTTFSDAASSHLLRVMIRGVLFRYQVKEYHYILVAE